MAVVSELAVLSGHEERVWCVQWDRRGDVVASCGGDKCIRLWKRVGDRFECRTTISDSHSRTIRHVAFSPCNRYLASTGFDSTIVIYELKNEDYEVVSTLEGHENEVKCCAWSPSGDFLASCSRDKSVWFWQVDEDEDFQVCSILQTHTQDVKFLAWHPLEDLLVSCSYDDSLRFYIYDGEDWIVHQRIDAAHDSTVWCAAFAGDGTMLATVGDDRCIKVWQRQPLDEDARHSKWHSICRLPISDCRWPLYTVSWSPVTGLIAVGSGDNAIRIYRIVCADSQPSLELVATRLGAHEQDVNCVAWHPEDPTMLVSAGDDAMVKLWTV